MFLLRVGPTSHRGLKGLMSRWTWWHSRTEAGTEPGYSAFTLADHQAEDPASTLQGPHLPETG